MLYSIGQSLESDLKRPESSLYLTHHRLPSTWLRAMGLPRCSDPFFRVPRTGFLVGDICPSPESRSAPVEAGSQCRVQHHTQTRAGSCTELSIEPLAELSIEPLAELSIGPL